MALVPQGRPGWIDPNTASLDCAFDYEPLTMAKSFRLLRLHPAPDRMVPIELTMSERPMEESKGKYAALSYTWGDLNSEKIPIILNGKPALVTDNLHAALVHLRSVGGLLGNFLKESEIWIDALCINQQDNDEKVVQVGHMHEIFTHAELTVAWLGLEADGCEALLAAIGRDRADGYAQNGHDGHCCDGCEAVRGDGAAKLSATALHAFFQRGWWWRVWTFQEFMVGRMVWLMCGRSFSLDHGLYGVLQKILTGLDRMSYDGIDAPFCDAMAWKMYLMISRLEFTKAGSLSLMRLLQLTHLAQATDPRDRIFALLGMMAPEERRKIKLDYNLSPCDVFCNAIRVMASGRDTEVVERTVRLVEDWVVGKPHGGHQPLQEVVPARWTCDGIECSSASLCLSMPRIILPDAGLAMKYVIASDRSPGLDFADFARRRGPCIKH